MGLWAATFALAAAAALGPAAAADVQRAAAPSCLIIRDASAGQDVKMEQFGANAVRVRAVPAGGAFRDDLVSALVPPSDGFAADPAAGGCPTVALDAAAAGGPTSVISGNMRAALGPHGLLSFTRIHDSKVLLAEAAVRSMAPAVTVPELPGFYGLNITFKANAGERIYGLGQHKTGILDNAGGKFELSPHNTEIFIPVAHSSEGYSFLMNLPSFGSVEFGKPTGGGAAPAAPCPGGEGGKTAPRRPCPEHPGKTFCPDDPDPHQCSTTGLTKWVLQTVVQADFWVATTAAPPPPALAAAAAAGAGAAAEVSPWAQLQHAYANATGHAPVYPEWTSGFWQCKNRYHNQTQVLYRPICSRPHDRAFAGPPSPIVLIERWCVRERRIEGRN
eukprot:SAG22_NODE_7_length_40155_cov_25.241356_27_plen_389_part_00